MKPAKLIILLVVSPFALYCIAAGHAAKAQSAKSRIGERPALEEHLNQADIESGAVRLGDLLDIGKAIFAARWTKLDGQGRPAATGSGTPTKREPSHDAGFIRTSAPDSTSCADCHNQPSIGGAGGFVANVFVMAQNLDPVTASVSPAFSDERNTLGMNGSGAIEMLAREMSADLISIRDKAVADAKASGKFVVRSLETKGVNFGRIIAAPDGTPDTSEVQGVDSDLVVKPFHQKGVVNSVRVFTVNAFNHHHGMEAVERFGIGQRDSEGNPITTDDFDQDGVSDELTDGDITAATIFQVALNIPGRVRSNDPLRAAAADRGERLFSEIGCSDCHRPFLTLNSRFYSEPNPFNPPGNLRVQDVYQPYVLDLTRDILKPTLERTRNGGAIVRAFTDLKRHVICDDLDPFYCNERLVQNGVPIDQFLTRKLWDVGNTAPYGHRGDLTTITEAILHHAGEARPERDRFVSLGKEQQAEIIEFLKQLQVLPDGSPREVTEQELKAILKNRESVQDPR
jgi:hypothetical protein